MLDHTLLFLLLRNKTRREWDEWGLWFEFVYYSEEALRRKMQIYEMASDIRGRDNAGT